MQKKRTKWYADWRDERGRRRRKALPSKQAALSYQNQQRREVAAKKGRGNKERSQP